MMDFSGQDALQMARVLIAAGVVIGSLEWFTLLKETGVGGWYDQEVLRPQRQRGLRLSLPERRLIDARMRRIVTLRLVGGVALVLPISSILRPASTLVALGASVFLSRATKHGQDGSDQMLIHGLLAIFVADVAWFTDKRLADIALLYLALQALTAYATSGIVKLTSRVWRNGSGLMGVARTRTYGSSFAAGLNKRTATAMSWGVMSVEVAIPLVAFAASQEIVIALLVAGVMFHAIIALSMGLNTFVWGFVATYPAIWYTVSALRPW